MNKYEAAIAYFKERKSILAAKNSEDEAVEHINTAIEAMKKQVPRALHKLNGDYGECSFCRIENNSFDDRCTNCGQAIDTALSECINYGCADCGMHTADGPVCEHYADKADEIRRICEEAST